MVEQMFYFCETFGTEIYPQHRIFVPVVFKPFHIKTFKELAFPFEIRLQRRHQQAFAESARTTEEHAVAGVDKTVQYSCLVDIEVAAFTYLGE